MGIFGTDKKDTKKEAPKKDAPKDATPTKVVSVTGIQPERVLIKPHVSEKTFLLGEKNVHVFLIAPDANVGSVTRAVQEAYGVKPVDVRIAKIPGKKASRRMGGRPGRKANIKKAYVQLKEGDKLSLV